MLLTRCRSYQTVFVSHDRYFDKLATRVFEIGEGRVEVFPAIMKTILQGRQASAATDPFRFRPRPPVHRSSRTDDHDAQGRRPELAKRLNPIKLKQMKSVCRNWKREIARFEAAIGTAETALQNRQRGRTRQTDLLIVPNWNSSAR